MAVELPNKAPRDQIWLLGDSLAVGLKPHLTKLAAAENVGFNGSPVGGTAVFNWTDGAKYKENIDSVVNWPATLILVSLGTNDANGSVPKPNIKPLVDHLRSKGARVVWIGPPTLPTLPNANATCDWLKAQCAKLGVPYIDSRRFTFQRSPDKIHATPAGYMQWAAWLWPQIKEQLVTFESGWGKYLALGLLGVFAVAVAAFGGHALGRAMQGRRSNPRSATWKDFIRGEWWLTEFGKDFSDNDVGDQGHVVVAVNAMLSKEALVEGLIEYYEAQSPEESEQYDNPNRIAELRAQLYDDNYDAGYYYFNEYVPDEVGAEAAGSMQKWLDLKADERLAYARYEGAIQVVGDYFMTWEVTNKTISVIQSFLEEQAEGEEIDDPDTTISVEQGRDRKYVRLPIAEFLTIKNTRQLWAYAENR